MVTISASVDDPEYVDKASVMISSLERRDSGESVENKVVFARDLLNDNPECQELNELLVKAEDERLKKNYEEAIKLITTVVNGCKYLVNVQKEVVPEQPKDFFSVAALNSRNLPALVVGLILILAMFVFGILMIVTSRRRKGDMNF